MADSSYVPQQKRPRSALQAKHQLSQSSFDSNNAKRTSSFSSSITKNNNTHSKAYESPMSTSMSKSCSSSSPSVIFGSIAASGSNQIGMLALQRELEGYKVDLQREKNARKLDKIKYEQSENQLKRQVHFIREKVEKKELLVEEIRKQYESDVEEISQSRQTAIHDLMEAERRIFAMRHEQLDSSSPEEEEEDRKEGSLLWKKKCELLEKKVQAANEEVTELREALERSTQKQKLEWMHECDDDNNKKTMDSTTTTPKEEKEEAAPSELLSELHRVRLKLSDTERRNRLLTHKLKELQAQVAKDYQPKLEELNYSKEKIKRIEEEMFELQKEKEENKEIENQWINFRKELNTYFESSSSSSSPDGFHPVDEDDDRNDLDGSVHTEGGDDVKTSHSTVERKHPPEIATIVRCLQTLKRNLSRSKEQCSNNEAVIEGTKNRVSYYENELKDQETKSTSLEKANMRLQSQLKAVTLDYEKLKAKEDIWQREVEGMRSLLQTLDAQPQQPNNNSNNNKTNEVNTNNSAMSMGLELSLQSAKDQIKLLSTSEKEWKEEKKQIMCDKQKAEDELDRVKDKFMKLRDALMTERQKVEHAEERASAAERLAGQGSYNETNTRVLHFHTPENPMFVAFKQKYQDEIDRLKNEMETLKQNYQQQQQQNSKMASTLSPPLFCTSKTPPSSAGVDAQKFHRRLKEQFKQQISLFREGVYLLTGYKVDMNIENDKPVFTVRSMYGEKESDLLIFMWPKAITDPKQETVTSMDLLDSEFAQEMSATDIFQYMTKFKSIPAFMSSLTLSLFEKQTYMG